MGQSQFKWIIVFGDGTAYSFEGTFNELITQWSYDEPIAIIRGEFI
ncbi:unnamed protein product [marine sediment metagenome]|uniref:Uncharacterized protein n=1 Tax=marine sediment metagenome TaxID=412755 RepID=X1PRK3_9ZZZZ